ncbi:MAG: hypothetical protein OXI87_14485 [Albidovulum sp.]|nr:hypothetical protein [Albidovulum sp.]
MFRLPSDRYSRLVIALRVVLPAIALAGLWAAFKFVPETPHVEEFVAEEVSNFASLRNSEFGSIANEGFEIQVGSELTEWKDGVALSKNVRAKVDGPDNMVAIVRAAHAERIGNDAIVSFRSGAELSTNFGYSLVSDGFQVNVEELDFNSIGEVFLTFPGGFGAAGYLDFEPAADDSADAKYPGSLKLENNVIIVFSHTES